VSRRAPVPCRLAVAAVAVLILPACAPDRTATVETGPSASGGVPCADERLCSAPVGDLLEVSLAQLRPTQPSLGYDEVYYRLGRYTLGTDAAGQLLGQWCATNGQGGLRDARPGATLTDPASFSCSVPVGSETDETTAAMKTVVIGPGGQPYLTDGHHTLTSFWEAPGGGPETRIRLKVTGNLSGSEPEAFWAEMTSRGWTWLQDADGKAITAGQLPESLGLEQFADDIYRGALYFVRDVGYRQDEDSPAFQEFYWAQWLRDQSDPGLSPADADLTDMRPYLRLVDNVATAIVALPADAEVAAGRTASELGRLDAFGREAFGALDEPVDSPKPGKLAYALAYKAGR
jgi:hypothetical protein